MGAYCLDIFRLYQGELWRLFTSTLIFENTSEALVGLILLYTCRQFERQMGSKKFAAFICFSFLLSSFITVALLTLAAMVGVYIKPAPGPYYIIFALLTFYYCEYLSAAATAAIAAASADADADADADWNVRSHAHFLI